MSVQRSIRIRDDLEIPMRDGVILRANVYEPDDDAARPVVLLRFPYLKESFESRWGRLNPLPMARAGYRVVIQDIRGTGNSDGEMDFDGPCQKADGYDTVEWVAAQSWCDGNVGMYGLSYYGFTQLLAAETRPPHLKAIAPWMQTGLYKYWGGFTTGSLHLMWLLERCRDRLYSPRCTMPQPQRSRALEQVERYLGQFPTVVSYTPEGDNPAAKIPELPLLEDYLRRIAACDDPATMAREGRPIDFDQIDIPCFFLGGWYDDTSKNGPIENWGAIVGGRDGSRRIRNCSMVMGPWNHGEAMPDGVGVRSFGSGAGYPLGQSVSDRLIRFFDRYLKGEDNGYDREDSVVYFCMGENRWHSAPCWPLPGSGEKRMYLSGDGHSADRGSGVLTEAPERTGADVLPSDPEHPVPARMPGINSECQEQSPAESRPDVAVYTSAPLEHDLVVAGEVRAEVYVSSDCPDTDLVCKLTEVLPDGRSINLTDGAVRVSYNNSWTRRFLEPGEIRKVEIRMGNTCNLFRKGSRIRLDISGSAFPKYDRNHQVAAQVGSTSRWQTARDMLYFGAETPSCLILTVQNPDGKG